MFLFFLVLTVICAVLMIGGAAWWLIVSGTTTRRSGPGAGAEVMGGSTSDDEGVGINLVDKSVFRGKGASASTEAEVSYGEIKGMLRERRWREALPSLLAMVGLYFFIVFGAFAFWFGMQDKLVATVISGAALFTMGRIGYDFIRS